MLLCYYLSSKLFAVFPCFSYLQWFSKASSLILYSKMYAVSFKLIAAVYLEIIFSIIVHNFLISRTASLASSLLLYRRGNCPALSEMRRYISIQQSLRLFLRTFLLFNILLSFEKHLFLFPSTFRFFSHTIHRLC